MADYGKGTFGIKVFWKNKKGSFDVYWFEKEAGRSAKHLVLINNPKVFKLEKTNR